jgi:hypothetical protein
MEFETDGLHYDLLTRACEDITQNKISGMIAEVGTRKGGSLSIIANKFVELNDTDRVIVSIDPYGDCLFFNGDGDKLPGYYDYSNKMRDETIPHLHLDLTKKGFNFIFMNMEDTEFFKRYPDGIPTYNNGKKMETKYALVFLDGPHNTEAVMNEVIYFAPRISEGGFIAFDNIDYYNHMKIDALVQMYDFVPYAGTWAKQVYIKLKNEVL